MNHFFTKTSLLFKIIVIGQFLFLTGCTSMKQIAFKKDVSRLLNKSDIFSTQFTGFSLYDLDDQKYIADYNAQLKFTPASNTKLLTMYAVLKTFPDSIPSLLYQIDGSNLRVQPLGDPGFLYHRFERQKAYDFLNQYQSVEISWPKHPLDPFGSGWAWDDYVYDFQPERSWWPIYGNALTIKKQADSSVVTSPSFFGDYLDFESTDTGERIYRDLMYNRFTLYLESDTSRFERSIPFSYSKELLKQLLSDTLDVDIAFSDSVLVNADTLYSYPTNYMLAYMLKPSDNFLAEQLLILAARENGFYEIRPYIYKLKNSSLADLSDIVWVDGSGLSRYNLISPMDQVKLLKKCHDEFGWQRITSIVPTGGQGTLRQYYLPDEENEEEPFIFAKTGTLSNNHNLSGFLVAKSGKRLIFSLMSNHYTKPTKEIKVAMEQFMLEIKEAY